MEAKKGSRLSAKLDGLLNKEQTGVWIDNEYGPAASGRTFEVIDPATEEVLADVALGAKADIDRAVAAAEAALQGEWGHMTPSARRDLLLKVASLWETQVPALGRLEALNNGTLPAFQTAVIGGLVNDWRYHAGWADKVDGRVIDAAPGTHSYVRREPLGVCGMILPWNVPLWTMVVKLAPCLAMGNTVVIKPAEQTPLTALRVAQLFKEAGFPKGVVNVVPGLGGGPDGAGATLASHMRVRKIAFTGSTEVGRIIMKAAADSNLKRVQLELGGKSPVVVFEDANIEKAVQIASMAVFWNNGQLCTAGSRTFVHEKIYDKFVEAATEAAKQLQVGDPSSDGTSQIGPLVDKAQYEKVLEFIESGKTEGAVLKAGGSSLGKKGYFVKPTVFANVNDQMRIAREEIFGPVQSIIRFSDPKEVIARCNNTEYGLAAAVVTEDIAKVFQIANSVQAGTIWVNTYHEVYVNAEFGGFKQSGFGREGGSPVDEWTISKSVIVRYAAL